MNDPQPEGHMANRVMVEAGLLDARHNTGNERARQAHLDDRNQCAGWFEVDEGPTPSYSTSAWAAPSVHSERWMQYPRRGPIASSIMGFEDEVEQSFGRPCRECNGTLTDEIGQEPRGSEGTGTCTSSSLLARSIPRVIGAGGWISSLRETGTPHGSLKGGVSGAPTG